MSHVRSALLAGSWYEADPNRLRRNMERWTKGSGSFTGETPRLVLVPHAGHAWSGAVAGAGFARLKGLDLERVVLLAPSHHVPFQGVALPGPELRALETPLGNLALDAAFCAALQERSPLFVQQGEALETEHALEVELPFLAHVLPKARVVPLVCGALGPREREEAARVLADLLEEGTVLVVSSDLTHYGPDYGYLPFGPGSRAALQEVRRLDMEGIDYLLRCDVAGLGTFRDRTGWTACGATPAMVGLLALPAETLGELLLYTTSAEISGDCRHSVSYASLLFQNDQPLLPRSLKSLVRDLALDAVQRSAISPPPLPRESGDRGLDLKRGVFVTLRLDGALRGCIGHVAADRSLGELVPEMARDAALKDPRFPPLRSQEARKVQLSVSVLSPPRRISSIDEMRVPHHGLWIQSPSGGGLLLPQVARELGLAREAFLKLTLKKAGLGQELPSDARLSVFTATVF